MIKFGVKFKIFFTLFCAIILFYGISMVVGIVPKNWTELRYGWKEHTVRCELIIKSNGIDSIYQLNFYRPFYGDEEYDFKMEYDNREEADEKYNQFVEWKKRKDEEKKKNTYKVIETSN